MGGDVVDRTEWFASRTVENRRGAQKVGRHLLRRMGVAAPETAHAIAVAVVPLAPVRRKPAKLVAARANIPRLGDQFAAAENRVLLDRIEEAAARVKAVRLTPQGRCEIEAKAVDPHHFDPVAQRIHHHPQHERVADIHRVAAAAVVYIMPSVTGLKLVVGGVVQSSERQCRPAMIAFRSVVVDHVEDHLDPGGVQPVHGCAEPVGAVRAQISRLQREEADGVVAPVIREAAFNQKSVVDKGVDRQQLQRGDAKACEMVDHRIATQRLIRAAQFFRHIGV